VQYEKLPCSDERSNQFDFWIGEWDLTWIDKEGNTQTWVDNQGGYLEFEEGMEEEKMILSRTIENEGNTIQFRMVFHNIAEDSFLWS